MEDNWQTAQDMDSWKKSTLIIGVVIGALLGLGAAYVLIQNAEKEGAKVKLSAGEGVKLGITAMALLRQVAEMGSRR
jgi:hypothetical protein